MGDLIVATENLGKFEEIKTFLGQEFDCYHSLADFHEKIPILEDSALYVENALKKARKIGDRFGMYTIADDSGLEVAALSGRPGVHSARYGRNDSERIDRLLRELHGVPWEGRHAVFKAYIVFYLPDRERAYVFYGHLKGIIGIEKVGVGGFGYDPVFYVPEKGKYLAELSMEEKNGLSHRGRALAAFKLFLQSGAIIGAHTCPYVAGIAPSTRPANAGTPA